jgi:hypothetical protein
LGVLRAASRWAKISSSEGEAMAFASVSGVSFDGRFDDVGGEPSRAWLMWMHSFDVLMNFHILLESQTDSSSLIGISMAI